MTSANRFDKNFMFIVSSDGQVGFNFEQSWGDGISVLRLIQVMEDFVSSHTSQVMEDFVSSHTSF